MKKSLTKSRVIKFSLVFVAVATGLGIGFGVGLRGKQNNNESINQNSLVFSLQNVNNRLEKVLAVNLNRYTVTNFSKWSFLQSDSSAKLSLKNTSTSIDLTFNTGENNKIYNGFDRNGHIYIPITQSSYSDSYLELETATNSSNASYLYVEGLGQFDQSNDNLFATTFSAINLVSSSPRITLYFGLNERSTAVPQPSAPGLLDYSLSVSDVNNNLKSVLNTDVSDQNNFDFSNFIYLSASSSESVKIDTNTIQNLTLTFLTGSSNYILTNSQNYFYSLIDTVFINGNSYNACKFKIETTDKNTYIVLSNLYNTDSKSTGVTLSNIENTDITVELNFAIGN